MKIAKEYKVPIVGRGAGTGLSGGAIPRDGGIMIAFARMNRILEIDLENERAVVQPGVVNLDITLAVQGSKLFLCSRSLQPARLYHRRQRRGECRRAAHAGLWRYHESRPRPQAVLPDGTIIETGGKEPDLPGYDLTGLLTGSEGTMALVTKVIVRLMRQPEAGEDGAGHLRFDARMRRTRSPRLPRRAITPVAVEMLDGVMLRMVEEATHAGYPMDAAAVLLIELEGLREAVEEQVEQVRDACYACGAREFRVARSAEERDLLWKGRKNAFGAIGRVSPSYYVQDGVVPRTKIAPTLRYIGEVGAEVRPDDQQYLPCRRREHASRSFCSMRATPANSKRRGRRARTSLATAFQSAGRSRASTASGMEKKELMGSSSRRRRWK